jgi:predicted RNA-binding Zn-ribbon protein involved in translation (DUF1610 family)
VKVIREFPDLATAELARSVLEAHGIQAWVPDSNLASLDWRMGTALGGVRLQVAAERADEALALLEDSSAEPEPAAGDESTDERCPFCGSDSIGRDDQRRLLMATLLFFPLLLVTLPMMLVRRKGLRCAQCGRRWRQA